MKKYDVIVALEGLREARKKWNEAKRKFDTDVNLLMDRLMREAAVNMMSATEVATAGGWTRRQVTDRMRRMDMNPKKGKRLLAAQAAQALADNAALLGIQPWEMDHMSPLMYLPMGSQLRALLEERGESTVLLRVSREKWEEHQSDCIGAGCCGCCLNGAVEA